MSLFAKARLGQSQQVYDWQDSLALDHVPLSLTQCQQRVDDIWVTLRSTVPPVISDGRGSSYARAGRKRIALPRYARTLPFIIHEIAHSFSINETGDEYLHEDFAQHGEQYARLLIDLLVVHGGAIRQQCLDHAERYGVKVASSAFISVR